MMWLSWTWVMNDTKPAGASTLSLLFERIQSLDWARMDCAVHKTRSYLVAFDGK
jgi:hypothetical protein